MSQERKEERVIALLMGELSGEEAQRVERQIAEEGELGIFYERMRRTMELLGEALQTATVGAEQQAVEPKLTGERRRELLERFRGKQVKEPDEGNKIKVLRFPRGRDLAWMAPLGLAASVVMILGLFAYMTMNKPARMASASADGSRAQTFYERDEGITLERYEEKKVAAYFHRDEAEEAGAARRAYSPRRENLGMDDRSRRWSLTPMEDQKTIVDNQELSNLGEAKEGAYGGFAWGDYSMPSGHGLQSQSRGGYGAGGGFGSFGGGGSASVISGKGNAYGNSAEGAHSWSRDGGRPASVRENLAWTDGLPADESSDLFQTMPGSQSSADGRWFGRNRPLVEPSTSPDKSKVTWRKEGEARRSSSDSRDRLADDLDSGAMEMRELIVRLDGADDANKLPGLGDIPALGQLFRSETKAKSGNGTSLTGISQQQPSIHSVIEHTEEVPSVSVSTATPVQDTESKISQNRFDSDFDDSVTMIAGVKLNAEIDNALEENFERLGQGIEGVQVVEAPIINKDLNLNGSQMGVGTVNTFDSLRGTGTLKRPALPEAGELVKRETTLASKPNVLRKPRANAVTKYRSARQVEVTAGPKPKPKTSTSPAPAKPRPAPPASEPKPEVYTKDNPYSTFSLNVSDVSFKLAAASLGQGRLPEAGLVRSEEFINAFEYHDPLPSGSARLAFGRQRAQNPFAHQREFLRLTVQTAALGRQGERPLNLVLLLDNSGSMERADRVAIIREGIKVLASQLKAQDRISVVAFARRARLWVDALSGDQSEELLKRVMNLNTQGGTNLEQALELAYATAQKRYLHGGNNRVILMTDGAANLGNVDPLVLQQKVEEERGRGIALDCFGIGWEGYNDNLLEILSRHGDGRYGFINTVEEAASGFAAELAGALRVMAANVKAQIQFNPQRVISYRQLGYEKHRLTKEQFRDERVDAAEIGAAEAGTVLYSLRIDGQGSGPLGVARVRYMIPESGLYEEREWLLPYEGPGRPFEEAAPALRLAVVAGVFAEVLAGNPYSQGVSYAALQQYLPAIVQSYTLDERPQQLAWMVNQARSIAGR
jgi:Mg-chelatase subunit ChlD